MKIFLSYASQDREIAQSINHALREQGHDVFFDREDLMPGEEFHNQIRLTIERADLFVFLISEHAIDPGSYTLNELDIAEKVYKKASRRILPVMLQPISMDRLPTFAKSVTLLQSPGNIPAAVADAVHRITQKQRRIYFTKMGAGISAIALMGVGAWFVRSSGEPAKMIKGSDDAPLMLVPAGNFTMGDDVESPQREIYLDAFYIDRYEVTTGRYEKFLSCDRLRAPTGRLGVARHLRRVRNFPLLA